MKMGPITIAIGSLLVLLGVGAYGYGLANAGPDDKVSPTALIPAGFGLILIALGALANKESLRMHVMHVAVLIGLVGFGMPLFMVIRKMMQENFVWTSGPIVQAAMAGICGVFVALCVKSFIDARRARKQAEASSPAPQE